MPLTDQQYQKNLLKLQNNLMRKQKLYTVDIDYIKSLFHEEIGLEKIPFIFKIIENRQLDILAFTLNHLPEILQRKFLSSTYSHESPLMFAIKLNFESCVHILLQFEVDVDFRESITNKSILYYATESSLSAQCIEKILQKSRNLEKSLYLVPLEKMKIHRSLANLALENDRGDLFKLYHSYLPQFLPNSPHNISLLQSSFKSTNSTLYLELIPFIEKLSKSDLEKVLSALIFSAVRQGHYSAYKTLITKYLQQFFQKKSFYEELHLACCEGGNVYILKDLILLSKQQISPEITANPTSIGICFKHRHLEILDLWLQEGQLNFIEKDNLPIEYLYEACSKQDKRTRFASSTLEIVSFICKHFLSDENKEPFFISVNYNQKTPLYQLLQQNEPELNQWVQKNLLLEKYRLDKKTFHKDSYLHAATLGGSQNVVKTLLSLGLNPFDKTLSGHDCFTLSLFHSTTRECFKTLISYSSFDEKIGLIESLLKFKKPFLEKFEPIISSCSNAQKKQELLNTLFIKIRTRPKVFIELLPMLLKSSDTRFTIEALTNSLLFLSELKQYSLVYSLLEYDQFFDFPEKEELHKKLFQQIFFKNTDVVPQLLEKVNFSSFENELNLSLKKPLTREFKFFLAQFFATLSHQKSLYDPEKQIISSSWQKKILYKLLYTTPEKIDEYLLETDCELSSELKSLITEMGNYPKLLSPLIKACTQLQPKSSFSQKLFLNSCLKFFHFSAKYNYQQVFSDFIYSLDQEQIHEHLDSLIRNDEIKKFNDFIPLILKSTNEPEKVSHLEKKAFMLSSILLRYNKNDQGPHLDIFFRKVFLNPKFSPKILSLIDKHELLTHALENSTSKLFLNLMIYLPKIFQNTYEKRKEHYHNIFLKEDFSSPFLRLGFFPMTPSHRGFIALEKFKPLFDKKEEILMKTLKKKNLEKLHCPLTKLPIDHITSNKGSLVFQKKSNSQEYEGPFEAKAYLSHLSQEKTLEEDISQKLDNIIITSPNFYQEILKKIIVQEQSSQKKAAESILSFSKCLGDLVQRTQSLTQSSSTSTKTSSAKRSLNQMLEVAPGQKTVLSKRRKASTDLGKLK